MRRKQNVTMLKLRREVNNCELCGSSRNLEVHHIIPVCFGGPEDDVNNMIVVCRKCHTLLTPNSILIKKGMRRAREGNPFAMLYNDFYGTLNEYDGRCDIVDVLDVFDELTNKYSKRYYGETAHNKEVKQ